MKIKCKVIQEVCIMPLLESGQMYLETIYVLCQKNPCVRSIDVCEHMGFSKPSVSRAVGLLRTGGYINMDENGYLTLTDLGMEIATKMYERHQLLSDLFIRLGVSPECASDDACKIEHHISDETFAAIKNFIND